MLISRTLPAGRRRIFFSPVAVKSRCFSLLEKSSAAAAASALPQFTTGKSNGFLPRNDPLVKLPKEFDALESLLQRMPLNLPDGKPGLLAQGKFGDAVEKELPLIDVSKITDSALLTALFRDYTFAASAYLLEPCDLNIRKTGNYGLGRELLPKQLAVPLTKISEKIGAKPFMEYALSYSLYNFQRSAPDAPLIFPNLKLIRSFQNSESEAGFILVHVAMVAYSGHLVAATTDTLKAAEKKDRAAFDKSLGSLLGAMRKINKVMDSMWGRSLPNDYKDFRTFIMGTKNQPMFPKGVIYEGVSNTPQYFRGESGANDSMIPTCDNLLQLTQAMPKNPLTEILRDFRTYRPVHHNQWLTHVEEEARRLNIRKFAMESIPSATLYLAALDQVRDFRARHWNFTKEYILKHSKHPVATGGSPIATWLPNQLTSVLEAMKEVHDGLLKMGSLKGDIKVYDAKLEGEEFTADDVETVSIREMVEECGEKATIQRKILKREVEKIAAELGKKATDAHAVNQ